MAARIEPTDEQLHAAWLQRRRGDWPASFEAVMATPLLATLVRCEAVQRVIAERRFDAKHPVAVQAAQPVHWPQVQRYPHGAPTWSPAAVGIDRKRAAAGDRDDD